LIVLNGQSSGYFAEFLLRKLQADGVDWANFSEDYTHSQFMNVEWRKEAGDVMLKPQDILILLKVHLWQDREWRYGDLADSLHMSASEVHGSLKRSAGSKLYNPLQQQPIAQHLLELIIHGLKYVYPAEPGKMVRGIPTAHGINPLKEQIVGAGEIYVWAYPQGTMRGVSIEPLYKAVPYAANQDQELYELLGLVDALRVGRVREQQLAADFLQQRLMG
jgi:hypothetical protein